MRCVYCMQEIEPGTQMCVHCRSTQDISQKSADALPLETELRGRFVLGRELGRGGFGITYIGYDKYFDSRVAIKEYYPQNVAARMPGEKKIFWRNAQLKESGCRNVIREARKMNRISDISAAVHVLDVFYENDTAYIAMEYVDGITLKQYLFRNKALSPQKCYEMMMPIIDTMIKFHANGIIHRDISPDNIMIQSDMSPRILDLGAAKDIQKESGNTVLVARHGFSPREQYQTDGNIGTWTDVYALCATMYYSLTGKVPPSVMDRVDAEGDLNFPSWVPMDLCRIINDGMHMKVENRIPDMMELKARLMAWSDAQEFQREEHLEIPNDSSAEGEKSEEPEKPEPTDKDLQKDEKPVVLVKEKTEKPKARRRSIFDWFTKEKEPKPAIGGKRGPETVTIADRDAEPCVRMDSDETVIEDDSTVLDDGGISTQGYLIQESTGRRIRITKCCFVLGRQSQTAGISADCMIEDATKHMSRRHAAVLFDGTRYYLQDLSGKNVTQLNGVRIANAAMPEKDGAFRAAYRLCDGDSIQLAAEKLTFHEGGSL